jgi:HEAT repeat protein
VRGRIASIQERDAAVIRVEEVLRGECPETIRVSPIIGDVIPPDYDTWVGRRLYLFLSSIPQNGAYPVQHQMQLAGDTAAEAEAAVERALEIAAIKDGVGFARAVLGELGSGNATLRGQASFFLQAGLEFWVDPQEVKDEIVAAFRSDDADVRRSALSALGRVRADEVLPELIDLTRSTQSTEAAYAARALAQYDTPEAFAALAALAASPDVHLRSMAVEALGKSRRQEAVDVVRAALRDLNSTVRARALTALRGWLREGRGGEAIPDILAMLGTPDAFELRDVLAALGASGDAEVVDAVLALIREPDPPLYTHDAALRALAELYPRVTPEAQVRIRSTLDFVAKCAETEYSTPGFAAVLLLEQINTPESAAILERITAQHADEGVRKRAASALARRRG